MKKIISLLVGVILLLSFGGCEGTSQAETQNADSTSQIHTNVTENTEVAVIHVRDYGTITVALDRNAAPATVENFVSLVNDGFYNGLTFHRIISGFMIQGGDPNITGSGRSAKPIKGEFSQNGFENPIRHVRGTISMARTPDPNSASSQFFIMHQDAPHLDGAYAGFGHVISGMEVVDAICAETPVFDGNGGVEFENQPIITSIEMK